jgi:hypothetical protein
MMTDEQRERLLIAEQIEQAEREAQEKGEGTFVAGVVEGEEKKREKGLQRGEGEKVAQGKPAQSNNLKPQFKCS